MAASKGDFYCRYYVGHKGKFGHEFLEFEFTSAGQVFMRSRSSLHCQRHSQLCAAYHVELLCADALRQQLQLQK